ncbi:non-ribosomal peptide synthetase [Pseudomonas sp. SWI44]|uniref:non-ribosomal peptide synthetase n=1 Tax=Pseudomonas sp. SWI44 TaxID=2083053 RepID=UPI00131A4034|nr:non-ribosomal peptide synthetase [Pseudomonas sp. SWI44]
MQKLIESVEGLSLTERKALAVMLGKKGINLFGIAPIFKRDASQPLLLSYAQERLWFLWQLDPQGSAYTMSSVLRLQGALDGDALQAAFDELVARHESLRTRFTEVDGQAVQLVDAHARILVEQQTVVDPAGVAELVEAYGQQPFDLRQGPLLRVKLLRVDDQQHVLSLVQHHIVSDGWSMRIMIDELITLYRARVTGTPAVLAPLPVQYADYALWQRSWMDAGERDRQQAYWQRQLGGQQPVLELPTDFPRPQALSYRGDRVDFRLSMALTQGLKALARREGVTLYTLLLAAFQALLYRYSGQQDVRVGVPVAGRNRPEVERLIGFFVNTQVLRAQVDGSRPFTELLAQVRQATQQAQQYQDLPFEQLVELLQPQRSMSHSPLFQVMHNHRGEEVDPASVTRLPGLEVNNFEARQQTAQFDLTLETVETPEGLGASLVFASDLFTRTTVERLGRHWQNLLHGLLADVSARVDALPLFDAHDLQRLIDGNNATALAVPPLTVHQLFAAQAVRTPDAPALAFDDNLLSYAALNRRANQLAHRLIALGVGPEVRVGLSVERGLDLVVGLLAILKAGGAYIPLDPTYPQARLDYMIDASGMGLLLTHQALAPRFEGRGPQLLCLDRLPEATLAQDDPPLLPPAESAAYVIYTSGSTGNPKGVVVSHQALANFVASMAQQPGLEAGDRMLSLTTFSFDIFGLELYLPLTRGAQVVLAGQDIAQDPAAALALARRWSVTALQATPSTWRMLLDHGDTQALQGCKCLCGGEALSPALAARMLEAIGPVWNLYGPTETTIWSARYRLDAEHPRPLLGQPIGNTQLYVVGADFSPVPAGVAGELMIGGQGLARGYLHRASLTAERFLPNPFSNQGERLYRTGDVARVSAAGEYEYIGRADHQVKIRGFRIELGEIESALLACEAVREAAVLAQPGIGGDQLVGYVVVHDTALVDADSITQNTVREQLKGQLKAQLPAYMVPAQVMFVAAMPLTPNGKLDRKALPEPDASQSQQDYVAPRTALEQQLAVIWQTLLKLERVGLHDNFFDLGGHSLLVTQLVSRIRDELGREASLRQVFETSTLQAQAAMLDALQIRGGPAITRAPREGALPLSYAQERLWFLWQMQPYSAAYHLPRALRLRGTLNIPALRASFDTLVARHEPLRTTFAHDADGVHQVVHATLPVQLQVHARAQVDDSVQISRFIDEQVRQPFDLVSGPLLRVALLPLGAQDHLLVLTQHHIVSDGWSMQVMVDELVRSYAAEVQGRDPGFAALPIQYVDYALWQRHRMEGGERERQLQYWRSQLGERQPVLQLPGDRARPAQPSLRGGQRELRLEAPLCEGLRQLAQRHQATVFMVLLAGFQALLHRYSGQDDIRVGVPVANRNRQETEGLLGVFINTLVMRAHVEGRLPLGQLIEQVRQTTLQAQDHQDLPFEQLVEALQPERSLSHTPLFQVLFNHRAQATQAQVPVVDGLNIEPLAADVQEAKFDLNLETVETPEGVIATLVYAADQFDSDTAERLLDDWHRLLQAMVADAAQPVGAVQLGSEASRRSLATLCQGEVRADSQALQVVQRFEAQARANPSRVALVWGAQRLSYGELDQRAGDLAVYLQANGVGPETVVAIAAERSAHFVVGLLAAFKAGAAFLPLDMRAQPARTGQMLEDSQACLLLGPAAWLAEHATLPALRSLAFEQIAQLPQGSSPRAVPRDADMAAYVIFTSGSTGRPKGVLVSQGALADYLVSALAVLPLEEVEHMALASTLAADLGYTTLFAALCSGRSLHLLDEQLAMDPQGMAHYMSREAIDLIKLVPSHLQSLLKVAEPGTVLPRRCLVLGGEASSVELIAQVRQLAPACRVVNHYGPSETTIGVLAMELPAAAHQQPVPLGRPLFNVRLQLLDAELNAVAEGVHGELYVGGPSLARGYLGRPGLTAERFVPDPQARQGERLYRTGDRMRVHHGAIHTLGRTDDQLKIRGYRVEPAEVAACLRGMAQLLDAAVVARDTQQGQQLVAYVVASAEAGGLREHVQAYLRRYLPEHMIPAHVVNIAALPLTANGKLDRQALPAPDLDAAHVAYLAPQTPLQEQVAQIWQDVLKVERVGLGDNFFELGGHSLLVMGVLSRLQLELGISAAPQLMFQFPVLNEFVDHLEPPAGVLDADRLNRLESLLDEVDEA